MQRGRCAAPSPSGCICCRLLRAHATPGALDPIAVLGADDAPARVGSTCGPGGGAGAATPPGSRSRSDPVSAAGCGRSALGAAARGGASEARGSGERRAPPQEEGTPAPPPPRRAAPPASAGSCGDVRAGAGEEGASRAPSVPYLPRPFCQRCPNACITVLAEELLRPARPPASRPRLNIQRSSAPGPTCRGHARQAAARARRGAAWEM